MASSIYRRVVLKLSGESMKGSSSFGLDPEALMYLAGQVKEAVAMGV